MEDKTYKHWCTVCQRYWGHTECMQGADIIGNCPTHDGADLSDWWYRDDFIAMIEELQHEQGD